MVTKLQQDKTKGEQNGKKTKGFVVCMTCFRPINTLQSILLFCVFTKKSEEKKTKLTLYKLMNLIDQGQKGDGKKTVKTVKIAINRNKLHKLSSPPSSRLQVSGCLSNLSPSVAK